MADQKYSELPAVVTPLSTDQWGVNQGGVSKSITTTQIIGGTTQGAIPFVGSGATLVQDSSNLFYDSANTSLGIGTNSPEGGLHVSRGAPSVVNPSSQANTGIFQSDGDGGITLFSPDGNVTSFVFGSPGGTGNEGARIRWSKTNDLLSIATTETSGEIRIAPGFLNTTMTLKVQGGDGHIGIGTITPDASAKLEISSTTKGVIFPRMTTTQRDAISSPGEGLMIYNTTTKLLNFFNGSVWGPV